MADAVRNARHQAHIQAWDALAVMWSAQLRLEPAERRARDTALARADVRAAMGLSAELADYLNEVFADGDDG